MTTENQFSVLPTEKLAEKSSQYQEDIFIQLSATNSVVISLLEFASLHTIYASHFWPTAINKPLG